MNWAATSIRQSYFDIAATEEGNRNDLIAAMAFGARLHHPPTDFEALSRYDGVFLTQWKVATPTIENRWMEVAHRLCDAGVKVVLFQEGEIDWALNRSWEEQRSFFELLGKVELLLTHNERDIALFEPFRRGKPSVRWRTCLNLGPRIEHRIDPKDKPDRAILFGSSYDGRANGLTGLVACQGFPNPLWHQNRSTGYQDRNAEMPALAGVKIAREIEHCGWIDWARQVSGAYIAVHPMPAAAAGRDQITFACLGIPCIGNVELDIQRELFPQLVVDPFDVLAIRRKVRNLINDDVFYDTTRSYADKLVGRYDLSAAGEQARNMLAALGWEA